MKRVYFLTSSCQCEVLINPCPFPPQGYEEQMWNLALLAAPGEQLDSARYFETAERPQYDKVTNIFVL